LSLLQNYVRLASILLSIHRTSLTSKKKIHNAQFTCRW